MQTVTVQWQEPRRESATAQEACADSARGQSVRVMCVILLTTLTTLHSRPVPETTNPESYRSSKYGPGQRAQARFSSVLSVAFRIGLQVK